MIKVIEQLDTLVGPYIEAELALGNGQAAMDLARTWKALRENTPVAQSDVDELSFRVYSLIGVIEARGHDTRMTAAMKTVWEGFKKHRSYL